MIGWWPFARLLIIFKDISLVGVTSHFSRDKVDSWMKGYPMSGASLGVAPRVSFNSTECFF